MEIPTYITQYWGRTPTIVEIKIRFDELEKSDYGYKTNEYKDIQRFFKRKDAKSYFVENQWCSRSHCQGCGYNINGICAWKDIKKKFLKVK